RPVGVPLPPKGLVAGDEPEPPRLEGAIHGVEARDPDRRAVIRGPHAYEVRVALGHDLEPLRGDELPAVAEVQPLVVLFLGQPARDQMKELRTVDWLQLH